jgi:hypothetical protein
MLNRIFLSICLTQNLSLIWHRLFVTFNKTLEKNRMTLVEERRKRLRLRWTAPKRFVAIIFFLIIALFFEYLIAVLFQSIGLVDKNTWIETFNIPVTNWSFTITISPLFHILPLSVIVVLLSSWAYLTKFTIFMSHRRESAKKVSPQARREQGKRRFKTLKRVSKRISQRLQRGRRALNVRIQQIRGISYISQRLVLAKAGIISALTVISIFICILILMIIAEFPTLIHNSIVTTYRNDPSFLGFVLSTNSFFSSLGQVLPPIGGLASAINNVLVGAAPGFRKVLEIVGTSITQPMVQLDLASKYVLSQNLAVWVSALFALAYGAYASSRSYHRIR